MSSRARRPGRGHGAPADGPTGGGDGPRVSARPTVEVAVESVITLGQVLKLAGVAGSGGQAKALLASGGVTVNGERESRRGRKLTVGDMVGLSDRVILLVGDGLASEAPFADPA